MYESISADVLASALVVAAEKYTYDICEAVEQGIDRIAAEAVDEVKKLSPVYEGDYTPKPGGAKLAKFKSGSYKKGWTSTVSKSRGTYRVTVHNKKYRLVHLLEQGHALRDGTGRVYGEVKAYKHIEIAADHAEKKIDKLLEEL